MGDIKRTKYEIMVKPYLNQITTLRENGASMKEIAGALEIDIDTFRNYMRSIPEVQAAWYDGKVALIEKIEDMLRREVFGYEYEETSEKILYNKDGEVFGRYETITKKRKLPDKNVALEMLRILAPYVYGKKSEEIQEVEIKLPKELKKYAE
jgi:hypothetical protein